MVLVPWLAFAFTYFGSPIPHSAIAKVIVGQSYGTLIRYLNWFLITAAPPPGSPIALWMIVLGLPLLGVWLAARERRTLLVPAVFIPLFCLALLLGRAPRSFPWYLSPVSWGLVVLTATGCEALWRLAARAGGRFLAAAALAAVLVAFAVSDWTRSFEVARAQRDWQQNETGLRQAVGEWLAAHTPPDAVVAMEAIGYQGVTSRRRVYD